MPTLLTPPELTTAATTRLFIQMGYYWQPIHDGVRASHNNLSFDWTRYYILPVGGSARSACLAAQFLQAYQDYFWSAHSDDGRMSILSNDKPRLAAVPTHGSGDSQTWLDYAKMLGYSGLSSSLNAPLLSSLDLILTPSTSSGRRRLLSPCFDVPQEGDLEYRGASSWSAPLMPKYHNPYSPLRVGSLNRTFYTSPPSWYTPAPVVITPEMTAEQVASLTFREDPRGEQPNAAAYIRTFQDALQGNARPSKAKSEAKAEVGSLKPFWDICGHKGRLPSDTFCVRCASEGRKVRE